MNCISLTGTAAADYYDLSDGHACSLCTYRAFYTPPLAHRVEWVCFPSLILHIVSAHFQGFGDFQTGVCIVCTVGLDFHWHVQSWTQPDAACLTLHSL